MAVKDERDISKIGRDAREAGIIDTDALIRELGMTSWGSVSATGTMSMTRAKFNAFVKSLGLRSGDGAHRAGDLLVRGDAGAFARSAKVQKAERVGAAILTEAEFVAAVKRVMKARKMT